MVKNKKYGLKLFGDKDIPSCFLERRNIVRMILFTTLYSLIFINVFRPFNSENWIPNNNSSNYFLYSSLLVIVGMFVVSLSRVLMCLFMKRVQLGFSEYILWLVFEAVLLAAFYVFIGHRVGFVDNYINENPSATFWLAVFDIYKKAAANTFWMLLIPYTISLLYLSNEDFRKRLIESENKPAGRIIQFKDEKGEIRFSTVLENVLYIIAADNYVNIKYISNDGISDYLLRRKMKNLEEDLLDTPLRRCHRSYMINLVHVTSIKHDQNEPTFEFDTTSIKDVTLTKTYYEPIIEAFMKYSGQEKQQ